MKNQKGERERDVGRLRKKNIPGEERRTVCIKEEQRGGEERREKRSQSPEKGEETRREEQKREDDYYCTCTPADSFNYHQSDNHVASMQ